MPIVAGAIADALHNLAFPLIIGGPRHSSSSCRLPRNEPSRPPFSSPTARRPRMPRGQTTSLTLSADRSRHPQPRRSLPAAPKDGPEKTHTYIRRHGFTLLRPRVCSPYTLEAPVILEVAAPRP